MKIKSIIFATLFLYCNAAYSLKINAPLANTVRQLAATYIDHLVLVSSHIAGKLAIAHIALCAGAQVYDIEVYLKSNPSHVIREEKGSQTVSVAFDYIPHTKIPYAISDITPDFKGINNQLIELAGPITGLAGCYLRLKVAQILNEYYRTKKSLNQSIKDGLGKPCFKDQSPRLLALVGFHALANTAALIHRTKNLITIVK